MDTFLTLQLLFSCSCSNISTIESDKEFSLIIVCNIIDFSQIYLV